MTEQSEPKLSPEQDLSLLDDLEAVHLRLMALREPLGTAAIKNVPELRAVTAVTQKIATAANDLEQIASQLEVEILEPFGDDESYWTIFRLFTENRGLGRVWSLDEIWQHLAKNYDMSQETPQTLEDTLLEWEDDIVTDARAKGVTALFLRQGDGFALIPQEESVPPHNSKEEEVVAAPTTQQLPVREKRETPRPKLTAEELFCEKLHGVIVALLGGSEEGVLKQADVKKQIAKANPTLNGQYLQQKIQELIDSGRIFKFRRNKVAYLSLEVREDEEVPLENGKSKRKEAREEAREEVIDVDTAQKVLLALCRPRRHVQQKLFINDLWRMVHGVTDRSVRPPDDEIESLKQVCKQLQGKDLVVARSEKMGTGGTRTNSATSSKRRRSATTQVFKVGLASQEVKERLQEMFAQQSPDVRADLDKLLT